MGSGSAMPRANWSRNVVYGAETFAVPSSVEEAQDIVRAASKLRVVGSCHCFNDIADTPGTQLSLARLNRQLTLDRSRGTVTVEGGIRYDELGPELYKQGYALHNYASPPYISIAGACATATHGSGLKLGSLATAVVEVEFINAQGDLKTLARETHPDRFPGSVVSLGALGPITRMTLTVEPDFAVRQYVYTGLASAALAENFTEIMGSAYSVGMFTDWVDDGKNQLWVKVRGDGSELPDVYFGARRASQKMHPTGQDASNCTEQMGIEGPSHDRLPHFRMGFRSEIGDELQVEYYLPVEQAAEAIKVFRAWGERLAPVMLVSEVRTVAADDMWLSPFYERASVAFHFSLRNDWPALSRLLPLLENDLKPFGMRPHWGKMFASSPADLHALYPRIDDFRHLTSTYDPRGKFRNRFLDTYIFQ